MLKLVRLVFKFLRLLFTLKRKQAGLIPRHRPVQLEPGFDQVPGIERMSVIQSYAPGISPPILVAR